MSDLFVVLVISFVISTVLTAVFIPILRKMKFGQEIREIGPSWHKSKSGTPTMGGIAFILATAVTTLAFVGRNLSVQSLAVLAGSVGFGLIGFADDYIKVVKKRNLGLLAWQKFALQLAVSLATVLFMQMRGIVSTEIIIPLVNIWFDLGIWYTPISVFVVLGCVNAVNLTDGIDGLVSSVTAIVAMFFMILTRSPVCAAVIGALLGFLVFNSHPAKVFMGDTGSLFLGGFVSLAAIAMGNPLILLVVGLVYVVETLSVILQVAYFKLTHGKRLFKMSPIHHHFEKSGWSEVTIVIVFSVVTMIMCLIGAMI